MGFDSADIAEAAYYEAFLQGDQEALMSVWLMDDAIECIHPFGPRVTGYKEVYTSWHDVLQQSHGMSVKLEHSHRIQEGGLAIHTLLEIMSWENDEGEETAEINTTNIYRKTENGWFMIAHHASPAPSQEMLAEQDSGFELH